MPAVRVRRAIREARHGVIALALALAACGALAGSAAAEGQIGANGTGAGEYQEPEAVAVDSSTGEAFVADKGNRRVDVFDESGEFVRAFGWGVVASGPDNDPRNQVEQIEVSATGGAFRLRFVQIVDRSEVIGGESQYQQTTSPIAYNAPASGPGSVQAALEALPAIESGDVDVSGAPGGPWTVEFTGRYADTRVHPLEGLPEELSGGSPSVDISTVQEGAKLEVCKAGTADVCRAGQLGPGAGQIDPTAITVDSSTHDVYVFDGTESEGTYNEPANNRVQKFTAEGEFLYMVGGEVDKGPSHAGNICTATFLAEGEECGNGVKGSGEGFFDHQASAVALGPSGVLYVADGERVQKYEADGSYIGEVALPGLNPELRSRVAVDAAGNIYSEGKEPPGRFTVYKYDEGGTKLGELPVASPTTSYGDAIAIDASGDLLTATQEGEVNGISRLDTATETLEQTFYPPSVGLVYSLAPFVGPLGDLFAIEHTTIPTPGHRLVAISAPPPGPVALPESGEASPVGNVSATLNAKVNPEGKATTFRFQYVDQEGFEEGEFEGSGVQETPVEALPGETDFRVHEAAQQIEGLTPETVYHFRVVASNADGSDRVGAEASFETAPPLEFSGTWSTEVGSDTATLHGALNPLGFDANGHFEYVDDAGFKASGFANATELPDVGGGASPLSFGEGEAQVERSVGVYGLAPGTTYHYRLLASDHCKPEEPSVLCTFEGPAHTLTTFASPSPSPTACANSAYRPGPGAFLPDCRAYEMVSPVDKNGGSIETVFNVTGYTAELNQAADGGGRITYSAYKSFAEAESAPYSSQYLATRGASGWVSESISPPREGPSFYNTAGLDYQFKGFTPDLCVGWPLQDTSFSLASGSVAGYPNLYRRANCGAGAGGYEMVSTVKPPGVQPEDYFPELQGFSADGSKAFFVTPAKLTSNAKSGRTQVYEASGGALKLVCVLPNGAVANADCSLGTPGASTGKGGQRLALLQNAVSEDGSRVFWSQSGNGPGKLYVRIDGTETVAVSEKVSSAPARLWGAAGDGSAAIFTVGTNLYSYDVETGATPALLAGGVTGVAGVSADASHVYFVSTEALAGGAEAGKPNLYLSDEGALEFVATLSSLDVTATEFSPIATRPLWHTSQVSAGGNQIVFMSRGSLTGYDNTDAATGEPDAEVYVFDAAAAGGAGELHCVSCNPSGARPLGGQVFIRPNSGYTPVAGAIPVAENQLYAPRVVSADGSRVFFDSFDALVARDTNGKADVYEWEAAGAGDCSASSPSFSSAAGGCLNLISSGDSPEDSELVDSSADGGDVFFKTASSLVAQDPRLVDIYDARTGGGFPAPPTPPAECEGEACQHPAPAPEDQTPSSSSFQGPGNPTHTAKRCPKGKKKVKKHGKVRCVKKHKKKHKRKHSKHHRARHGQRGRVAG